MMNQSNLRALGWTLLALGQGACSRDSGVSGVGGGRASQASARPGSRVSRLCVGAGASTRITLQRDPDGRETVRGDTDVSPGAQAGGRLQLTETATFDERGHLLGAEVVALAPPASETRFALDPRQGRVRIVRGNAVVDWRVPIDAPWTYRPVSSAAGKLVSTPVAALVALRAASVASVVRVLEPEREESYLAPADQVSVPTEKGTTVVLAGDGLDFDGARVTEVRLLDRSITLRCADASVDDGA